MQIACVQCRQPLPIDATFCDACGRPTDADRDGVPDALGELIANKARAIVAEERRLDEERAAAKRSDERLVKLTAEASAIELALRANALLPRSWFGAFRRLSVVIAIGVAMVWLPFGTLFHFLFGAISFSPAGPVLCPIHCEGCEGPGRAFAWNFKGSWKSEKGRMGYALVCHNKEHDIDKLEFTDVRSDPMNTKLQPYMIHGFVAYFVEGLVLAPGLGITLALLLAGKRRAAYDQERAELLDKQRRIAAERASLTGSPIPEVATFRG